MNITSFNGGKNPNHQIDPSSGFCSQSKIFHNLSLSVSLPPETLPLSVHAYLLSLLRNNASSPENTTALIDANTGLRLSYSELSRQIETLAVSLQTLVGLSKGETVLILSPTCFQLPILYLSLLSIGVVISPVNPTGTTSEISRQVKLCNPVIAFATSDTVQKIPVLRDRTVLLDSPEFHSMMTIPRSENLNRVDVNQSDTAAIFYSSGTTGLVKGVLLSHRHFIALIAGLSSNGTEKVEENPSLRVPLLTVPLFHMMGFLAFLRAAVWADAMVLMGRFEFEGMLKAIEAYRVTDMMVVPPIVVAIVKSEVVGKYDLSSLQILRSGGAPLSKEVLERFVARFPNMQLRQGYGLTETSGLVARMSSPNETKRHGSVGRLAENLRAKIVDPVTGEALPPGKQGELWVQGATIMKGYIGDEVATASAFDSEGWLKTGDLCYFDSDGFLFVVDRLKELIKYKAYQVPPAELEHLLQSHPEIADAAVILYPDEEAGQIPMAFAVRKPGSNLNEAQVMDFTAKQVAPYKKIRRVAFIKSVPKTLAGKILRTELLNHAISNVSSRL